MGRPSRLLIVQAVRDLVHRRHQAVAVGAIVGVGLAVFVTVASMTADLERTYDQLYQRTSLADVWVTPGPVPVDRIRQELEPEASSIQVRAEHDLMATIRGVPLRLRLVEASPTSALNRIEMSSGHAPDDSTIVLERRTAEHFGLVPGDQVEVAGVGPVEIGGVAVSPEWLWLAPSQDELVIDPDRFGVAFASDALMDRIAGPEKNQLVLAVPGHDPEQAGMAAAEALRSGALRAVTRADHPSYRTLRADLDSFEQARVILPGMFLVAAALATAALMQRVMAENRRTIGVLRANGYRARTLRRTYAIYGALLGLVGALPGVVLGIGLGRLATRLYQRYLGLPAVSPRLHPSTWLVAVAAGAGLGMAGAALGTRRAVARDPLQALHAPTGSLNRLARLIRSDRWAALPVWLRAVLRQMVSAPLRSGTTVVGVSLALLLSISSLGLRDSLHHVFVRQFAELDHRDLVVTPTGGDPADLARRLTDTDGVSTVEPHDLLTVTIASGDRVQTQRVAILPSTTTLHSFPQLPAGRLPDEGIVLSRNLARDLAVSRGTAVHLVTAEGRRLDLAVADVIDEPFAGTSYMAVPAWEAAGGPAPRLLAVGLRDQTAHRRVVEQVQGLPGVGTVADNVAIAAQAFDLLRGSALLGTLTAVLATLMGATLVFTTLTLVIADRRQEYGLLRMNGVPRRWLRSMLATELSLSTGIGLMVGLLLGLPFATSFITQFSTDQVTLTAFFRPWSVALTLLLVVVASGAAILSALRSMDVDLARLAGEGTQR